MSYVTHIERVGIQKGIDLGIEQGIEQGIDIGKQQQTQILFRKLLEAKFGQLNDFYVELIKKLSSEEVERILPDIIHAKLIKDVFKICESPVEV